jgi:hypothetical protein
VTDIDDIVSTISTAIPRRGSLFVTYHSDVSINPTLLAGYDFDTGACFRIMNGEVFARSAEGRCWTAHERGQVQYVDEVSGDSFVEPVFPWIGLISARAHPQLVGRLDKPNPGQWRLEITYPKGSSRYVERDPPPYVDAKPLTLAYEVKATELVIAASGKFSYEQRFTCEPRVEGQPPIVSELMGSFRLVSYQFDPVGSPRQFEMEQVRRRMEEAQTGKAVQPKKMLDPKSLSLVDAPPNGVGVPFAESKVHVGLLATGMVLLVVCAIVYLRRRAS